MLIETNINLPIEAHYKVSKNSQHSSINTAWKNLCQTSFYKAKRNFIFILNTKAINFIPDEFHSIQIIIFLFILYYNHSNIKRKIFSNYRLSIFISIITL